MKPLKSIALIAFLVLNCINCTEDNLEINEKVYSNIIFLPNIHQKNFNEEMPIQITFESANEETIHNISVRIFLKSDTTDIVYDQPEEQHIQETSGVFEFNDSFLLSAENGISPNSIYTIESKVWGPVLVGNEVEEIVRNVNFRVGD